MQNIVLDSCIFAKLFLNEEDSMIAKDFIKKLIINDVEILVPSIFTYEVYYVAQRYGVDTKLIDELLYNYKKFSLKEINLSGEIINKTQEIISISANPKSGSPSFYDSVYHAIAIINNCDFITSDNKHYEKTKDLGHIRLLRDIKD